MTPQSCTGSLWSPVKRSPMLIHNFDQFITNTILTLGADIAETKPSPIILTFKYQSGELCWNFNVYFTRYPLTRAQ